jgi:adenylosuccinate synthase
MSTLDVVVGGFFGSESKGHVTADLALRRLDEGNQVVAVRVAGHNAGHTAYDNQGREWALRTIPAAAVADPRVELVLAAGSEIDPRVLVTEIEMLEDAGISIRERLTIDPSATWLEQAHIDQENAAQMHEKSGSTAKGVGAARAARALRTARLVADWPELDTHAKITHTGVFLRTLLAGDKVAVLLEGTQGYGLGLHTRHYPLVTSSDCRSIDFLAMAGIDPTAADEYNVWVTLRPYPIRVAGPSGELKGETSFEALGQPDEYTTVTKKKRRVGEWDPELAIEAIEANGGPRACRVAMSMVDKVHPEVAGVTNSRDLSDASLDWIAAREKELGTTIQWAGTGPNSSVWLDV